MILLQRLRSIFYWILRKQEAEVDLDAELQAYVALSAADKEREGMPPDEARRRARLELGGVEQVKEQVRSGRHGAMIDSVWRDVRFGIRSLASSKRFTLAAVFTLALTIGGVTVIFTLVDSVLLRPLPYPESDRFVRLSTSEAGGAARNGAAEADFIDWRERSRSFDFVAGFTGGNAVIDEATAPAWVNQWRVTPDLFPMLAVRPLKGRWLEPEDYTPQSPTAVVISHTLWQSHYGGSQDIIGATMRFAGGVPAVIVGVMPPGFSLPGFSSTWSSLWTPLHFEDPPPRNPPYVSAIGRLASGTTITTAKGEMNRIAAQLAREYPETNSRRTVEITWLLEGVVGDARRILWIFFAAVGCVFLIGLANLANLQGVRNSERERELCVRAALGASRGQLVRQLLIESVLVGCCGGAGGILAAWGILQMLPGALPSRFPRVDQIAMDTNVLFFAAGVSVLAGVMFGLLPAFNASRSDIGLAINAGSRALTLNVKRRRIQQGLIAAQTAMALVLLVTGGLLANSFWRVLTRDSGLNEENLWNVHVTLPFSDAARARIFWETALQQIRRIPQVESAGLASSGSILTGASSIMGGLVPAGTEQIMPDGFSVPFVTVSGEFFTSIGAQIIKGRSILDTDRSAGERAVVLNESAAKLFWPNEDALGKRIRFGLDMVVVGIVKDFHNNLLHSNAVPQMYLSTFQYRAYPWGTFHIKAAPGSRLDAPIRDALSGLQKGLTIEVSSMDRVRWDSVVEERFRTAVLLAFALTATFLAVIGIWGVVSYSVVQRNREVAVRIAMGATSASVTGLMVRQAMLPAVIGLAIGGIVSLGTAHLLKSYLFGIEPTDPATFAAALACLGLAALLAGVVPARRAALTDPMVMLRHD